MTFGKAKALLLVIAAVLIMGEGAFWVHAIRHRPSRGIAVPAAAPVLPPPPVNTTLHATVPAHSNFVVAVQPFGLDAATVQALLKAARPVYNLAHIQAGNALTLERSPAGMPLALSYVVSPNQMLWLRQSGGSWAAQLETIPYVTHLAGISGRIDSSLFAAVEASGESDALALDLANLFGWDLDFYTDPQPGDVFRVLVEKRTLNGKFAGYGQIVAAEYVNTGKAFEALRFHDELGELAYYKPNGEPMKREFLRSPLKFAAPITSGFSLHRYHPILKIYRPHLGTDFAAPIGTPVQAIGNGVVAEAGRKGEDGNMVHIRHAGGYDTLYLHLSRILVHVGERVTQGERIGLVGMTGLATGPHLDFRFEHNGQFENFEVVRQHLPPASPVAGALRAQFEAVRQQFMPELEKLEPAATASAAPASDPPSRHN